MRTQRPLLSAFFVLMALVGVSCGGGGASVSPPASGPGPRAGDMAPAFTLPSAKGRSVSLAEFRSHKPVLLYFSMGPG